MKTLLALSVLLSALTACGDPNYQAEPPAEQHGPIAFHNISTGGME